MQTRRLATSEGADGRLRRPLDRVQHPVILPGMRLLRQTHYAQHRADATRRPSKLRLSATPARVVQVLLLARRLLLSAAEA